MGFDPIMMAMARPKAIDLTKYIVADYGNFNNAVLHLFSHGGGVVEFADNTTFWKDVATNRPVQFAIDASELGYAIMADAESRIKLANGDAVGIETSFLAETTEQYKVTILFARAESDTRLIVSVEPLYIS